MESNEIAEKEIKRRRYCVECESDADTESKGSDGSYDYYRCKKCGLTWRHTHRSEDVIFQKGFLQEQLMKVDALLKHKRELCKMYPDAIALRISYDSLMGHRKILVSAIEMIHSPVQFESIED